MRRSRFSSARRSALTPTVLPISLGAVRGRQNSRSPTTPSACHSDPLDPRQRDFSASPRQAHASPKAMRRGSARAMFARSRPECARRSRRGSATSIDVAPPISLLDRTVCKKEPGGRRTPAQAPKPKFNIKPAPSATYGPAPSKAFFPRLPGQSAVEIVETAPNVPRYGTDQWHADITFCDNPPTGTTLYSKNPADRRRHRLGERDGRL